MTAIDVISPQVTVDGTVLSDMVLAQLVSVRVQRALCMIGRATLRFADTGYTLAATDTFALGTAVKISVPKADDLIDGVVTGISLEQSSSEHPELVVTVDDAGFALTYGTDVTTYLASSYSDVLTKIASNAGLTASVSSSSGTNDYLLQTGSDLDYINRITQRLGYIWWIEGKTFNAKPPPTDAASVSLELMSTLLEFSVRASGLRPTSVKVSGWGRDDQSQFVGTSSPNDTAAGTFVQAYAAGGPNKLKGASTVADLPSLAPDNLTEAQAMAAAFYDAGAAGAVIARGKCFGTSAIKPAISISVTNAGPSSGTYFVSEVDHFFDYRGFYTRFVCGPRRSIGLVDTLSAPPKTDPGFSIAGLVVGKVSNLSDDTNAGRAKVSFATMGGQVESAWARVVTLGGGDSRGAVFQPEINDEVLVGFEYGDTRRPVIIGGLYSQKAVLPSASKILDGSKVAYRRITSRGKHFLEFSDGDAATTQHLLLQVGASKNLLRIGADRFDVTLDSGIPATIAAGDTKIDISQSGDVTISGVNITLKGTAKVSLQAPTIELKADGQLNLQGAMFDLKGSATGSIDGGGMLTAKGGMVQIN